MRIKRLGANSLRHSQRSDLGQISLRLTQRSDQLIDVREDHSPMVAAVLSDGRTIRLDTGGLKTEEETGSSQPLGLDGNEAVAELVPLLGWNNSGKDRCWGTPAEDVAIKGCSAK